MLIVIFIKDSVFKKRFTTWLENYGTYQDCGNGLYYIRCMLL